MRSILKTSVILVILLFAVSYLHAQKSFVYDSEEGKLEIKFPCKFIEKENESETSRTVEIQCEKDGYSYFASFSIHKIDMGNPLEIAEISLESFTKALKGIVITRTEWKVRKHEGIAAIIDMPDYGSKLEYRIILVGNIQYQLFVVAANNIYDEKTVDTFFKSFILKE